MNVSEYTTLNLVHTSWFWIHPQKASSQHTTPAIPSQPKKSWDLLQPLRQWLDNFEVRNPKLAHRLCKMIPAQCPFERDVKLFGHTLFHIPPMCKLNPLYEEVVALRFRAMCYLADECGEDITCYCQPYHIGDSPESLWKLGYWCLLILNKSQRTSLVTFLSSREQLLAMMLK